MALTTTRILQIAATSDFMEENASDYLEDLGIALVSHSRDTIIRQALHHGWQPYPDSHAEALRYEPDPQPPAVA